MKSYAEEFYKGPAWQKCREAYARKQAGLCENCLKKGLYVPGEIVHHKTHITPDNINDPTVTLSFDNLQLLCRKCHGEAHSDRPERRYTINRDGSVNVYG